jgi:hypothetical protein
MHRCVPLGVALTACLLPTSFGFDERLFGQLEGPTAPLRFLGALAHHRTSLPASANKGAPFLPLKAS